MTTAYEASPVFESANPQLSNVLARVHSGELAIPDFQRDFVWDDGAVLELLQSVMSRHPAGSILTWKQDQANPVLASRTFFGAPNRGGSPNELVLDGQQRLTSLYRALNLTEDSAYFAVLSEFMHPDLEVKSVHEVDWDKALLVFDVERERKRGVDVLDPTWQFANHRFPLTALPAVDDWLDDYVQTTIEDPSQQRTVKSAYRKMRDTYLIPLKNYGFPVIALPIDTPIQAVCTIFETLNRTGRPLGAFELVTARLYPQRIRLRDLWTESLDQYEALNAFQIEPYTLLQAVTLRAHESAQRVDVLRTLTADDIRSYWSPVVRGMAEVLDFLRSECGVLTRRLLPYSMIVAPMAALWPDIEEMKPLERGVALDYLKKFFWCTTFMTNYDQGANSQAGADYKALRSWILGKGEPPEAVANFSFSEQLLRATTVRRKALLAGVMALTVNAGAKDFHSGSKLTPTKMADAKIDSHHIFPRAFIADPKSSELVLNRALIDSETNKIIGKKAPTQYISVMEDTHGREKLNAVLGSHLILPGVQSGLEADDYELFLQQRAKLVCDQIEEVTESIVSRG